MDACRAEVKLYTKLSCIELLWRCAMAKSSVILDLGHFLDTIYWSLVTLACTNNNHVPLSSWHDLLSHSCAPPHPRTITQ